MSLQKKQIRELFRRAVFERDGHLCVLCASCFHLDAHHITNRNKFPNGGYVLENGITLCDWHHRMAEEGIYRAEYLYQIIKASYELAVQKDKENGNQTV